MPESKGRKAAEEKKKHTRLAEASEQRADRERRLPAALDQRAWVPATFITLLLLGVLWLVVWYLTSATGTVVPLMTDLGSWNMLIGMGLMAASFGVSTLWK